MNNQNETTKKVVKYDIQGIMRTLKEKKEMDPDLHDGSYEMMRETIQAYARLRNLSMIDYHDLNLVYLTTVGTWKQGISSKKDTINDSHLSEEDKEYLKELWDEIWKRASEGKYENSSWKPDGTPTVGMFGTGFFTFQTKTTDENARDFISMCIDFLPMKDDQKMYDRAAETLTSSLKGMQAASASMVLHCLKPFTFPVLNSNMGHKNIFEVIGVPIVRSYYLETYIRNCREIKAFRDRNFTWKNYRIFDMAAWDADKYTMNVNDTEVLSEQAGDVIEQYVNDRVRGKFIQQISDKKKELESLNQQRDKLQKEIELLEEMLGRM